MKNRYQIKTRQLLTKLTKQKVNSFIFYTRKVKG